MADDELFDGTQPLPAAPFLPDPLSGLVTGVAFSDTTIPAAEVAADEPERQAAAQPEVIVRRARQATQRRSSAPGATTPTAIPVAEALPSRPTTQARRPATVRPAEVPLTPPVRTRRPPPARPVPTRQPPARPAARTAPAAPARRAAGGGCGLFMIIVVLLLVAFVVLGVVLGNGVGGFGGG